MFNETPATLIHQIGPNALIQTVRALQEDCGERVAHDLLSTLDEIALLVRNPTHMVDEARFIRLVNGIATQRGKAVCERVLRRSGGYVGDYILENRIPSFFQRLLGWLPRRISLRVLLMAISRHAWTFVGSGDFRFQYEDSMILRIACGSTHNDAVASFYEGAFERLIQALIDPGARVARLPSQQAGSLVFRYVVQIPHYDEAQFQIH